MTTYAAIANVDIDQDSAITQPLMTALRDNPIAISEGSAGAPRIEFAALGAWAITNGGVGTYVFARRGTGTADISFGGTIGGSNLVPTAAAYADNGGSGTWTFPVNAALSGTWMAMGRYTHLQPKSGSADVQGATLFLRIS